MSRSHVTTLHPMSPLEVISPHPISHLGVSPRHVRPCHFSEPCHHRSPQLTSRSHSTTLHAIPFLVVKSPHATSCLEARSLQIIPFQTNPRSHITPTQAISFLEARSSHLMSRSQPISKHLTSLRQSHPIWNVYRPSPIPLSPPYP